MFISSHCVTLRVEACYFELEGDHEIVQIKRSSNYRAGAGMNGRRATLRRHNTKKLPLDSLLGIRCYYAFLAGNFVNNAAVYPRKHAYLHAKLEARPTLYLRPLHPRKPQRAPWRHSISRPCREMAIHLSCSSEPPSSLGKRSVASFRAWYVHVVCVVLVTSYFLRLRQLNGMEKCKTGP